MGARVAQKPALTRTSSYCISTSLVEGLKPAPVPADVSRQLGGDACMGHAPVEHHQRLVDGISVVHADPRPDDPRVQLFVRTPIP